MINLYLNGKKNCFPGAGSLKVFVFNESQRKNVTGTAELVSACLGVDVSLSSTAPEIDEAAVMQLAEMGFPLEACRKAVYYTGNMGPEMAFNWIIAHMEEPGKE